MIRPLFDPSLITFVASDHTYYVDVDGSTISPIALSNLLQKTGLAPEYPPDIPEFVMARARVRGTKVHAAVAAAALNQEWDVEEEHLAFVDSGLMLMRKYDMKPEMVETPLFNPVFEYCSTPDFVGKVNGKPSIVDWKTTRVIHHQASYQLAGQALCFREPDIFDWYIGDLRNGVLQPIKRQADFLSIAKRTFGLYNEVQDLKEEME